MAILNYTTKIDPTKTIGEISHDKKAPVRTFRDSQGNERYTNMPNAQPRRGEKEVKKPEQKQPVKDGRNKYTR